MPPQRPKSIIKREKPKPKKPPAKRKLAVKEKPAAEASETEATEITPSSPAVEEAAPVNAPKSPPPPPPPAPKSPPPPPARKSPPPPPAAPTPPPPPGNQPLVLLALAGESLAPPSTEALSPAVSHPGLGFGLAGEEKGNESESNGSSSRAAESEKERNSDGENNSSNAAPQVTREPMRPYGFYFTPEVYNHYPKISTRLYLKRFEKAFNTLSLADKKWFRDHPQFSHILHMPVGESRMCMPIWMLLVRAVDTGDRSQVWFIVNGVPIRYSIREHGILSGLNCDNYPANYNTLGGNRLKNKYFNGKTPKLKEVEAQVMKMRRHDGDKLRMTVLLFLW